MKKFDTACGGMAILLLAGCATVPRETSADRMAGMIGQPIDTRIARNGPPTTQWDMADGRRAYQWEQSAVVTNVGAASFGNFSSAAARTGRVSCFYTLYARKDQGGSWLVVGFEQPRPGCP
jgi:hypothetical protein